MKSFFRYFLARLKCGRRTAVSALVFTLVISLCVLSLLYAMFSQRDEQYSREAVKVGICGSLEDTYLEIGLFALENLDSSNIYVEFLTLEEKEAEELLQKGDIFGYVVVPEDFVGSVMRGENYSLRYVAGNNPQSMGPQLMNEVVKMVSDFVTETQNCIYAYMNVAKDNGVPREQYRPDADLLNFSYIDSIIARNDALEISELGVGEGLDFKTYYACSFFVLMIMLCGCACGPLLIKRDMSLERLMYSRGCKSVSQVMAELIPFILILALNCGVLLLGISCFSAELNTGIELIDNMTAASSAELLVRLMPVIVLLGLVQFFVYELCSGMISGMLLQLFVCIALGYVSGFFYPIYTLPGVVQSMADYLPTHIAFEYTSGVFTLSGEENTALVLLCIGAALVLCFAVRRRKIRSSVMI